MKVITKKEVIRQKQVSNTIAERHVLQRTGWLGLWLCTCCCADRKRCRNVDHPFLLHLYYSFQTKQKLYFVMDYVNGGELFFHLEQSAFSEQRVKFYAAEIVLALVWVVDDSDRRV